MLNIILQTDIMLTVITLSAVLLSGIMLSVTMLSVLSMLSYNSKCRCGEYHYAECQFCCYHLGKCCGSLKS
jgi:hypothetical protein